LVSFYLTNRVALVTGASRGIGKSIALELAKAGASLALISRNEELLRRVSEEAKNIGVKCLYEVFDVSDEDRLESFIHAVPIKSWTPGAACLK
jgi:NAD(P)-dependent dehydrogenase (short-subunit alcohol dehydrogenase family)